MPLVDGAEALFGAVSSNSAVTRSLSALGSAIDEAPISPLAEDEAPLSPLWEPIILARKPLSERSVAANVLLHGTGGVNVDACRIEGDMTSAHYGGNQRSSIGYGGTEAGRGYATQGASGRWPANVILDEEAARLLDEQSGELHSQRPETRLSRSRVIGVTDMGTGRSVEYAGTGGASRFFYTAKADSAERTDGMAQRSKHPTVKPLAIMVWLVKLVTPPGGVVLDPFLGSGTTAIACVGNGFSCIGIEREAEYVEEARQRVGLGVEVVTWSGMPAT
jgi:site-specific DNA-methyltransferase (adenine-specific)